MEVVFEHVTKRYPDGTLAVDDVVLRVAAGELFVLVGPSGCGKSTLLRLLAGLETPTAGRVLVGERDVTSLDPRARDVAMVFQNYALYPHLDVAGNLAFPLRVARRSKSEIQARVRETAELLGLSDLLRRRPAQLSGGQRQRVAMGRALIREPLVFLMDEPLSNLDAQLRDRMRSEIAALQRRVGVTTLFVTHDQVEAMTLGQRICVLDQGRVKQVGDAHTLYTQPANRFVATFLGSPPLNVVRARLEGPDLVLTPGLRLRLPDPVASRLVPQAARIHEVGLRPEAVCADGATRVAANVRSVEALGYESHVSLAIEDGPTVIARLPAAWSAAPGERVEIGLDLERLHAFAEDGAAL